MEIRRIVFAFAVLANAAVGTVALAQDYPSKTVKFVLPSAAGSAPDRVVRMLATELAAKDSRTA